MPSIVQLERTKAELALALRELDNLGTGGGLASELDLDRGSCYRSSSR